MAGFGPADPGFESRPGYHSACLQLVFHGYAMLETAELLGRQVISVQYLAGTAISMLLGSSLTLHNSSS